MYLREATATLGVWRGFLDREVAAAREAGCSWAEIGAATGLSRQGAHHRWAKTSKETEGIVRTAKEES
jgi:hypothetical protein